MNEEYDVIVLGTGLKECILSGLLSVNKKKVLHVDRNNYYGGEAASLNLKQLWERFRPGQSIPESLGASRDYNVDMVPKFIMANGLLVRVLVHTDVVKYLEFKGVDGSYVFNRNKVCKVPATDMEALKSSLMGLFEKRRARSFFLYVQDWEEDKPATHKGMDLTTMTMAQMYQKYGLDPMTIDFIGHAIALHPNDQYLSKPAIETVKRIQLYNESLLRFNGLRSPYLYPLYGLGELPQAFARLSAVYGGTYMLNKPDVEVTFDEAGKAVGIKSEGETATAPIIVGDPSYFPSQCSQVGMVVRAICIMSHPIPNTNDSSSVQIIIPQKQTGRKSDMYVFCESFKHMVAAQGKYIAFVSTEVETNNPEAELAPGLALLGAVDEKFVEVRPVMQPSTSLPDGAFVSKGYDATTHFETTVLDVLDLYAKITGAPLDLSSQDLNAVQGDSQ